jgi:hypothetical protein
MVMTRPSMYLYIANWILLSSRPIQGFQNRTLQGAVYEQETTLHKKRKANELESREPEETYPSRGVRGRYAL